MAYLSKIRVRKEDQAIKALLPMLLKSGADGIEASHRLLWSAFGGAVGDKRDFLYRECEDGVWYVLSAREPNRQSPVLEVEKCTSFDPAFPVGTKLGFLLRFSARKRRVDGPATDMIGAELARLRADGCQREDTLAVAQRVVPDWIAKQGEARGFRLVEATVLGVDRAVISHRTGGIPARVIEVSGVLEVVDPARFGAQLLEGIGRQRAYGFGMMMVRPV